MITKPLGNTGLTVSALGLGTVEIGLPYGIGVDTLPSDKEAERILKTAVDLGITYFDTARGYGVAEERLGKFGISRTDGVVVGTKCAQFLEKGEDPRGAELEKKIRIEVEESLRLLKVDSLQLLQLHGGTKEQIERGELIDIVRHLIEEGKVQHVGIATRGADAPLAAIDSGFFETIQTAYSILDQRMAQSVLPQAQAKNVGIINRSVLLKGALTPAVWQLPPQLDPLKEHSAQAAAMAKQLHLDLPTLAVRFAASNPAVSTILLGTIKPQHLRAAQAALAAGPLPEDVLGELYKLAINDENQVDPAKWPKDS
ncbi:MAG TPA: aldo/keto reductase [Candidatus Andersenbacteria bacterium]|nr:aldo/keto reductase [Candidatus Andersenbacteria bacterium]